MQGFLTSTLGPIFYGLGVSEADFASYLSLAMGYVYALLIALAALLVVLIGAQFAQKGNRTFIRLTSVAAFALAVCIIANLVCFGPLRSNLSMIMNAHPAELTAQTLQNSRETIRKVGEEGFVLLKNKDYTLPLSLEENARLNVFGWASTNPIYGGTGSGSSDTAGNTGILEGLQAAGFSTNTDLTAMYTNYMASRPSPGEGAAASIGQQDWSLPEPSVDSYTDELMDAAKAFSDQAVIVLSRSGGEGADLPKDMRAVIDGTYASANAEGVLAEARNNYSYFNATYQNNGDTPDFDAGESYLELSNKEEDLIQLVCGNFDDVIVILNANNPMELGWVDEYEQIGAVIWAPGPGATGFAALGEILSGAVNPSGRTAEIFLKDLFAATSPYINNFGNFRYTNVDDVASTVFAADPAANGTVSFVNYVEGIYVGYKYWETAYTENFLNYDRDVQYPFGYGLSYTEFTQEMGPLSVSDGVISFDVTVINDGSAAGKDVIEVYFNPPYTNGGIEKASANLVQFAKTGLIPPGGSETVSIRFSVEDMASYDSEGVKVPGGGYILEAGDYGISIRENSHTVIAEQTYHVDSDVLYNQTARASDSIPAVNVFEDNARGDFVQLSRANSFANFSAATAAPANFEISAERLEQVKAIANGYYDSTKYDNPIDEMPTQGADNGLVLYDLVGASYDDPRWETLIDQMSFDDMVLLSNLGGWQTAAISSVGKIATSDCDGPAGLNNFITGNYGTSYPGEIVMAQTWSKDLLYELGQSMTKEYDEAYNYGWYGPAMNTHRGAFAGRNFEYYSEDGVLAGYLAAAEINGSIENGVYPYIKHFALNDQESNRNAFLCTYASEQAIREIYLKPFEIAVKNYEGPALAVMSAFNFIGTVPATANSALLNTVLRGEWGFVGMVETDYDGSYGYMNTDMSVRNGNDLMLGFANAQSNVVSNRSATMTRALRQASKNILFTIVNSGYYTKADSDPANQPDRMVSVFRTADIAAAVVLVLFEAFLIWNWRRRKAR